MLPSETIRLRQEVAELLAELASRPSAEAVQAAVEALGSAKYEILEYAIDRNVDKVVSKINNAIAGLTGGDMHIENPTVGQLRLALLQENSDGE